MANNPFDKLEKGLDEVDEVDLDDVDADDEDLAFGDVGIGETDDDADMGL